MAIKSLAYLFAKRLIIYFRNNFKGFIPHVCIKLSSRSVSIRGVSSYQSRTFHVIELFAEAIAQAQAEQKKIKSMAYRIFCSDYVSRYPALAWNMLPGMNLAFSACKKDIRDSKLQLIPDFVFNAWPEAGIEDYDQKCTDIVKASQVKPIFLDHIFWAGNINTHESRMILKDYSKKFDWLTVVDTSIKSGSPNNLSNNFVSLEGHCRYSFLIDLQGIGYSGRVKLLLFSGRCLFLQEREFEEWYYQFLKSYVHFIPLRNDLSDLEEKYIWAINNKDEVDKIAKNAQHLAINLLTRKGAVRYILDNILAQR